MELILLLIIIALIVRAVGKSKNVISEDTTVRSEPKVSYKYRRKGFVMTKAENDFFNQLTEILGKDYYVFPQVHLSSIFDHKITGQNWNAAFRYINQKSVDYVVCNKEYRRPLLGIELDDWSHDSDDRKLRDVNVEYIFKQADIPLLRFRNVETISKTQLEDSLSEHLPKISGDVNSMNSHGELSEKTQSTD